jgi:hypothetical protein
MLNIHRHCGVPWAWFGHTLMLGKEPGMSVVFAWCLNLVCWLLNLLRNPVFYNPVLYNPVLP